MPYIIIIIMMIKIIMLAGYVQLNHYVTQVMPYIDFWYKIGDFEIAKLVCLPKKFVDTLCKTYLEISIDGNICVT